MFYLTIVNKVLRHCHFLIGTTVPTFFLLQGSLSVMKKLVEVHPRNNKQNDSESESEGTIHNLALSSEKNASETDSN